MFTKQELAEIEKVRIECDEACRQTVLHLLGRDEAAEERQLLEIVARVKAAHEGKTHG